MRTDCADRRHSKLASAGDLVWWITIMAKQLRLRLTLPAQFPEAGIMPQTNTDL